MKAQVATLMAAISCSRPETGTIAPVMRTTKPIIAERAKTRRANIGVARAGWRAGPLPNAGLAILFRMKMKNSRLFF